MAALAKVLPALGALCSGLAMLAPKPWAKELQRRVAQGKPLLFEQQVAVGEWLALVGSAVVLLAAAGLVWWLFRRGNGAAAAVGPRLPRWFGLSLGVLFLLAAGLRLPRMNDSLWNDEMLAMSLFTVGQPVQVEKRFVPQATFYGALRSNPIGNNHPLCLLETRAMHAAWRAVHPHATAQFSEAWLRTPALLWGLLAVVLSGLAVGRWLGAPAGVVAAFFLAVHPWAIRLGTEVRGYSGAMAGLVLAGYFIERILRAERVLGRHFVGLGFGCAIAMLGVPISAPYLAGLSLPAAWVLWRTQRAQDLGKAVAAVALAASVYLLLAYPALRIGLEYQREYAGVHFPVFGQIVFQDILSGFASGDGWLHGLNAWTARPGATNFLLTCGFWGLFLLGSLAALRQPKARWLVAAVWGSAAVFLLQNKLSGYGWLTWYWCPLLPGVAVVLGSIAAAPPRWLRVVGGLFAAIWLVGLPSSWAAQLRPRQPMREAAAYIEEHYPEAVTAYFGMSFRTANLYLKQTHAIKIYNTADSIPAFQEIQAKAVAAQKPFVVWYGGEQHRHSPAVLAWLSGQGLRPVATFLGSEKDFDFTILASP